MVTDGTAREASDPLLTDTIAVISALRTPQEAEKERARTDFRR